MTYLLRPDHFRWLLEMAEIHNLGFTNKTLKETVDHELRYRRRHIEAAVNARANKRKSERSNWKRIRNCRLPDRVANEVQSIAATYHVDFVEALHVIVGDAVRQIEQDHELEDIIFEAPRTIGCTSTLIRDLTVHKIH